MPEVIQKTVGFTYENLTLLVSHLQRSAFGANIKVSLKAGSGENTSDTTDFLSLTVLRLVELHHEKFFSKHGQLEGGGRVSSNSSPKMFTIGFLLIEI